MGFNLAFKGLSKVVSYQCGTGNTIWLPSTTSCMWMEGMD